MRYILFCVIFLPTMLWGQLRTLTVKSSTGNVVSGATLLNSADEKLAQTDSEGIYRFHGPINSPLIKVHHLAYVDLLLRLDTVLVSDLTVVLQQIDNQLEEIVINTGFQQLPKERTTGSFSVIGRDLLAEQVNTNLMDRLPAIANAYNVLPATLNSISFLPA